MGRRTRVMMGAALVMAGAGWLAAAAWSQDPAPQDAQGQKKTVVKTKDGLHFNVPADWPIEERNGAVGPIPVEEYMPRKFAGMDSRLKTLEQQVAGFDLRLRVLEETMKDQQQQTGLRSSGQGAR